MIDLDQLAAFVAIAERRTVTAAALKLHRSQSAVSRRLALLEDALGAQLFDRRGTKLALTDVGRAFMPFAERALAAVASGREAAVAQREPRAGTVSIAIVGTLVDADLARALAGASSGVTRFRVLTGTSTEVSRMVRRGEVNLGVRYLADGDAEIVSEPIGVERMRVVRSPALEDCDRARWIGFPLTRTSKDDFGRLLQRRLAPLGVDYSEVMTVDSLTAQKRLVEAGLGIALLPQSSVTGELQRETLVVAEMPAVETTIPIVLVSRRKGYLSPAASDLAAMLGRAFPRD
jgi:DNA-binding transcriptional LysR family regulator